MPIRIRFIPGLAAFSLGGFLALCAVSLALLPKANKTSEDFIANYGHALSAMAAKQAVDASFNHDLVRLQVILQDVTANPHAVLATIHDVENNLLVQAGDTRRLNSLRKSFTSPINLHDSIYGYVSVTIDGGDWSLSSSHSLLAALSALFLCLCGWSFYRSDAISWPPSEASTDTPPDRDDTREQPEAERVTIVPAPPQEMVYAAIHIKNLHVLRNQLNGQSFRDTITRLEKIMSDVMALYGGHRFELVNNAYLLEFNAVQGRGEALFHATCSAYLILELSGIIDKIPLDLAALVSANEDDVVPEKLPFAGLIVEATAGAEGLINRRIAFMDLGTNDGRRVVSGFQQPFKTLLENQRKQLNFTYTS